MEVSVHSDIFTKLFDTLYNFLTVQEVYTVILASLILFIIRWNYNNTTDPAWWMTSFYVLIALHLGFLIISNALVYLFGIRILTSLTNIFTDNPLLEVDITTGKKEEKEKKVKIDENKNEVFHISGNSFKYDDAEPVCKAYGARLATYDEIEDAYRNGAEWCEYGWSEGQMAFFPTQKETWKELQSSEKNKNACGRPGINGGYMENPNIRFGVNCYGVKPDITHREKCLMENTSYYNTPEDREEQTRQKYWEKRIDDMILSPFNENKWSRI